MLLLVAILEQSTVNKTAVPYSGKLSRGKKPKQLKNLKNQCLLLTYVAVYVANYFLNLKFFI